MKDKFRYNKKRKHYSYIFKIVGNYCINILLTTQSESKQRKKGKTTMVKNIKLSTHPNPNTPNVIVYIYNHAPYYDPINSFDLKTLKWKWNINDKRIVKRLKKYNKHKQYFINK